MIQTPLLAAPPSSCSPFLYTPYTKMILRPLLAAFPPLVGLRYTALNANMSILMQIWFENPLVASLLCRPPPGLSYSILMQIWCWILAGVHSSSSSSSSSLPFVCNPYANMMLNPLLSASCRPFLIQSLCKYDAKSTFVCLPRLMDKYDANSSLVCLSPLVELSYTLLMLVWW